MITTKKQCELIQLISEGKTIEHVADYWKINRRTVDRYLDAMRYKYEAVNLYHLVAIFLRKKMIK